ncbi:hypothetical protein [Microbulbifer taiwanensis]|uniref:Uncharacterized protein n=1 Tax=Microbulbifer taiwanensis TaxID=986746 RepID=A0ABW1YSR4_9GAMM|nr:hypothetical protein [Microbulbifer taiwanensis]
MRKNRKVKARERAAAAKELSAVENPTELPESFNKEGGQVPPAPVALEVFTEKERELILWALDECDNPDNGGPIVGDWCLVDESIRAKLGGTDHG